MTAVKTIRLLRVQINANGMNLLFDTPIRKVFEPLPNTNVRNYKGTNRFQTFMFGVYDLSELNKLLLKYLKPGYELDFSEYELIVGKVGKRCLYLGRSGKALERTPKPLPSNYELLTSVSLSLPSLRAVQQYHHQTEQT